MALNTSEYHLLCYRDPNALAALLLHSGAAQHACSTGWLHTVGGAAV